ncbi:phage head-tail joining protein, partial [Paenirhodobacter sp.]|uniref:phage head-tail joining protein n=1 Tax=Paenirhodobacter sp. TaxID=1965326 RepID=UPI003B5132A6
MADLTQLTAWRDALMAARYRGVRTVEYDGKRITYASDGEMAVCAVSSPLISWVSCELRRSEPLCGFLQGGDGGGWWRRVRWS